jgi:hypothetical protein
MLLPHILGRQLHTVQQLPLPLHSIVAAVLWRLKMGIVAVAGEAVQVAWNLLGRLSDP